MKKKNLKGLIKLPLTISIKSNYSKKNGRLIISHISNYSVVLVTTACFHMRHEEARPMNEWEWTRRARVLSIQLLVTYSLTKGIVPRHHSNRQVPLKFWVRMCRSTVVSIYIYFSNWIIIPCTIWKTRCTSPMWLYYIYLFSFLLTND